VARKPPPKKAPAGPRLRLAPPVPMEEMLEREMGSPRSMFVAGGRPNVVEEGAKALRAMCVHLEEASGGKAPLTGLFLEATVGALEFQAELLEHVAREMRENGDVSQ
jgi:hypothetical protein